MISNICFFPRVPVCPVRRTAICNRRPCWIAVELVDENIVLGDLFTLPTHTTGSVILDAARLGQEILLKIDVRYKQDN